MRIAVCERYQMHTECIGPIYYMCKKLGHECVVYTCEQDDCNMLPFFEKCLDDVIQTRDISDIYRDSDQFDFIVLNTSDEWNETEIKMMGQSKVVVLHHDQKHENESMLNYFYLHPFKDEKDWIFPIYPCSYIHTKKASSSVMIIGTVNAFKDEYIPSKDLKAIERYLRKGKKLQVCARTIDDLEVYNKYPNLKIHLKKSTDDMIRLINDIDFIWIPVHVDGSSIYNKTSFSGSISFGVNMNKIMIMPKVLQNAYGLKGVLTYEKDISEIDLKKIDKIKIRKELDEWKQQRNMKNLEIFKTKLKLT
jgi:hypothetical protein